MSNSNVMNRSRHLHKSCIIRLGDHWQSAVETKYLPICLKCMVVTILRAMNTWTDDKPFRTDTEPMKIIHIQSVFCGVLGLPMKHLMLLTTVRPSTYKRILQPVYAIPCIFLASCGLQKKIP